MTRILGLVVVVVWASSCSQPHTRRLVQARPASKPPGSSPKQAPTSAPKPHRRVAQKAVSRPGTRPKGSLTRGSLTAHITVQLDGVARFNAPKIMQARAAVCRVAKQRARVLCERRGKVLAFRFTIKHSQYKSEIHRASCQIHYSCALQPR